MWTRTTIRRIPSGIPPRPCRSGRDRDLVSFLGLLAGLLAATTLSVSAQPEDSEASDLLAASWSPEAIRPVLDKTLFLHLAPDTTALTEGEKRAVSALVDAGGLLHEIYLDQKHPEALAARERLRSLEGAHAEDLRTLFRLSKGPILTTLDNERAPFLPVGEEFPGKNLYPLGIARAELDAFFADHPERRGDLLHVRSVVRRAGPQAKADLATLDQHAVLDVLHPGLRGRLERAAESPEEIVYYALPYSVTWSDRILEVHRLLHVAADAVHEDDPAFARYLRLRSRDLLADDYDGGDAAWVTSPFSGALNAQVGSYETYDDALYGSKSTFSLSLLLRDRPRTEELRSAIAGIQDIENALPYDSPKRVREDIPVGVYHVLADFGQSRGTNTATILPNESHLARQYGRTILLRSNIMTDPQLFAESHAGFAAATAPDHHDDFRLDGNFYRTLWHEIGHYLGVDRTSDGRELDTALEDTADLLEEMKADLVSLFASRRLHATGHFDEARLRSVEAAGIRRVLQKTRPRRAQPYQTMQLIQWNWFLDRGLLRFENGVLHIDYGRYAETVDSLLAEVLALQAAGDRDRAEGFVGRWTTWDEELHGVIARRMRDAETARYRLVTYGILGETTRPSP